MSFALSFLLFCTVFLIFYAVLNALLFSDKRLEKRRLHYLKKNNSNRLKGPKFNLLLQMQLYKQSIRNRMEKSGRNDKLALQLNRAGLSLRTEEYVMFQWISTALGAGLLYLIADQVFFLIVGAIVGFLLPKMIVKRKQQQRLHKFNESLPDMITTVIGSLRAGFSFAQSLKAVTEESEEPMKGEVELVLKEMQVGIPFEEALMKLKERMPSEDLELMIQSILIQKQIGGNLATVLEIIVQTIRDRNRIARQIRTLTAQGRLSGAVIGALPVVLGLFIYMIQPEYMGKFLSHPIGWAMIGAGVISGGIGFFLMRKVTRIEV